MIIQTKAGIYTKMEKDGVTCCTGSNLDLYLDADLSWAVELVFQGREVVEHVDRFDEDSGLY